MSEEAKAIAASFKGMLGHKPHPSKVAYRMIPDTKMRVVVAKNAICQIRSTQSTMRERRAMREVSQRIEPVDQCIDEEVRMRKYSDAAYSYIPPKTINSKSSKTIKQQQQ